jgi:hypothetical protein
MTQVESRAPRLANSGFSSLMAAVLEKRFPFRFQASGGSMSPFIRSGDIITIAPVRGAIHIGDVLAFRQLEGGQLRVHRVIARRTRAFLLRGDNGCHSDGWVTAEMILGRISRIEHKDRSVRFGLGPEKLFIALLSRLDLLRKIVRAACWLLRPVYKRSIV